MNLKDIFDRVEKINQMEREIQTISKFHSLTETLGQPRLSEILSNQFSAVPTLKDLSSQNNWINLIAAKKDSLATALENVKLPSYVTTAADGLLYTNSVSALANHAVALHERANLVNTLDFSTRPIHLQGASAFHLAPASAHLSASAAIEAPGLSNPLKGLMTFEAASKSSSLFERLTEKAIPSFFNVGAAAAFSPSKTEIITAATAIKSPWIEPASALRPIESVAGLILLGKASSVSPFSHQASQTVGALFGDWAQAKTLAAIPTDWQARREFYFEHGFDRRLTNFPEPAFTQALISTDILRPDLFSPVFPRGNDDYSRLIIPAPSEEKEKDEVTEEDAVKQRMLEAYDLLYSLETHLREFIISLMEQHCGPKWVKQRIPDPLPTQWANKKQTGLKKGEDDYPLIWYADFSDYVQIITRKDNWAELFESIFSSQIDLQASFYRLQPLRISTMHARPISQEDFLLLTVETNRILRAIGKIDGAGH